MKKCLLGSMIPLVALTLVCLYYWCFVRPRFTGDLSYLGCIPFPRDYADEMAKQGTVPKWYHDFDGAEGKSVLVIGDSYSNTGNTSYLNFMAQKLGGDVANYGVNFALLPWGPEEIYCALVNTGFFEAHPEIKVVLVESVGRSAVRRLRNQVLSYVPKDSVKPYVSVKNSGELLPVKRCFDGAMHWMNMATGIGDNPILQVELTQPMFSVEGREATLYFLDEDLKSARVTQEDMAFIPDKLAAMEALGRERGVQFIYLVAPDKYEVYEPFIQDNPYPSVKISQRFAEMFDTIDYAVCPLYQLRELLSEEKDVWRADDTHWSYKASEMVGDIMADRITSRTSGSDSIKVKAANAVKNP